jgi:hypothetical protein
MRHPFIFFLACSQPILSLASDPWGMSRDRRRDTSRGTVTVAERRYVGELDGRDRQVWVEEGELRRALPWRGEGLPVGFEWGRIGIAARELSRAILLDATGNVMLAELHCREMAHQVVAHLPESGFELDREDVLAWLAR